MLFDEGAYYSIAARSAFPFGSFGGKRADRARI
jgi:hypothetical protein